MKYNKILLLILIYIIFFLPDVFAHPHVRLCSKLEFDFDEEKCEGFWVEWKFDDYFSASIIREFDKNRDNIFSNSEIKSIYKRAFINLKNYGYFVFLRKGRTRQHPKKIEKFTAWQKCGLLFYRFYVPLKDMNYSDDFFIAIFDRTFYCDIKYSDNPVKINQEKGRMPSFKIAENKKYPVYYNPLGSPDDTKIYKKWKPGLQTAYPDEIQLFFPE